MTVYIAGRQTGKTIYLIRMSAKTGAVIVAPTYQMVSYIDQMARKLGLKIPPPISVAEWAQTGLLGKWPTRKGRRSCLPGGETSWVHRALY